MTLDEAIEILTTTRTIRYTHSEKELNDAERLGIEALKLIQQKRDDFTLDSDVLLPGETAD